ncbi:MAG: mannose-1-phosphate guanylyltransferase/mannose-6-phosphate isomerase [Proteobacteria bacterium]|nr:mannose-1-phosphate guanylyltransferase/mannose-6-phosphate isomerase [Pseudomonadota bacterium]MBU1638846.1 mannose-1-phosphate guanylyltransferase/mannose-6-phosphate isomerase [Pseudomonadota bacterium]
MIVPIILCGGSGSRLWPLSRQSYPKQLLPLNGKETLLQQTILRLDGLAQVTSPLVICNEEHRFLVAEQLREIDRSAEAILLEPTGRNTAPAALLAALYVKNHFADALLLVLPADHLIGNVPVFHEAILAARQVAQAGYLVAFGVKPIRPETAYGYIKTGKMLSGVMAGTCEVEAFVEKPDKDTAANFIASGEYQWNTGIYLMRPEIFLNEMHTHAPLISSICLDAYATASRDLDFMRVDRQTFSKCPADSIDYALMEKTGKGAVVPLSCQWNDVGSWKTLWEVGNQDQDGNVLKGDVVAHDSRNCYIHAASRLVATAGLADHIIVETADAVLVAHKEKVQDVRFIVAALEKQGRKEINLHRRVYRPWGSYETIAMGERFQVKLIRVKAGACLSLQMHHHRAEHWVVVHGTAQITRGDEGFMVSENESTFIPLGIWHRLANPGVIDLELIEIQSGSYLEEDDIIRFQDDESTS